MGMAQTVAQKESVMPKYVERRGNVLWFRRRAPPPLKPGDLLELDGRTVSVHANGYIHFSLKTSDIKEARVLARKYAHLCDKAAKNDAATADAATADTGLKRTRQGIVWPAKSGELTAEEIRFAAQSMYVDLLGADENTFNKEMERAFDKAFRSIEEGEEGEDDDDERVSDRNEWSSADLPPMTPLGQAELIRRWRNSIYLAVLVFTGKRLEELSPKLLPFADAIRRFVRDMERRKAAEVVPTPEMPHKGEVWTWQQTFDYYFQQRAHLGEATLCNYRIAWKSLAEFASGIPAGLTREKVVEWRDKLCTQVARLTAKNRLTNVAAIWRESLVNGKIPPSVPDPFAGLRVRIDGRTGTSRQEFDKAELKALFSSPPVSTPRGVSVTTEPQPWIQVLAAVCNPSSTAAVAGV